MATEQLAQDGFSRPELVAGLLARLDNLPRRFRLMEVCGTHTMALFETGLRPLLKQRGIDLLSGPGCPVCVTAQTDLDHALELAQMPDVTVCTFGDMLRVPGSSASLEDLRSRGADVRIVYSPLDAVDIAAANPGQAVVFIGVGFETTAPGIGIALIKAHTLDLSNFFVFPLNKTVPAALEALAARSDMQLDGLLLPGHVSVVIGAQAYQPLAAIYRLPCAIAGFEPLDILQGVVSIVTQILQDNPVVDNSYSRVVSEFGNPTALDVIKNVFSACDSVWRGLGLIPGSGLEPGGKYQEMDARRLCPAPAPVMQPADSPACRCGDVLCGLIEPVDCPLFGRACNPEHPLGACMVSREGSCRAYFSYHGAI